MERNSDPRSISTLATTWSRTTPSHPTPVGRARRYPLAARMLLLSLTGAGLKVAAGTGLAVSEGAGLAVSEGTGLAVTADTGPGVAADAGWK